MYLLTMIPAIFGFVITLFIIVNIAKSFKDALDASPGFSLSIVNEWLDPYRQSVFNMKHSTAAKIVLFFMTAAISYHYITADKITPQGYTVDSLLLNTLTYLPNYLIHEFSHRFAWDITKNQFFTYMAGNLGESLVPMIAMYYLMKMKGGRFLLPAARFWLASTFYDAGTYMLDAKACKMALTSSDMVSNAAAGTAKGDWYYIFSSMGMLDQHYIPGYFFCALAGIMLSFSLYSVWHFFSHMDDWQKEGSSDWH